MRSGLPSENWLNEPVVKEFSSSILIHLPFHRGFRVVMNPLETLFNSSERRMGTTSRISQYLPGQSTLPPWIRTSPPRHQCPTLPHHHSVLADSGTVRQILLHSEVSLVLPCLQLIHLLVHVLETLSTRHLLVLYELAMLTLISSKDLMSVPVFPTMVLVERHL